MANGAKVGRRSGSISEVNGRRVKTYKKPELIRRIASAARMRPSLVERAYDALWQELGDMFAEACDDHDVTVRPWDGVTIDATYHPPKDKHNNLTGEDIVTIEKIRVKPRFSRRYCENLMGDRKVAS